MEFLIELLLDLILEGSIEISSNKKISKWIRYPLIFLILSFFTIVIIGILFLGLFVSEENKYAGMFIIIIGITLLILMINKIKKHIKENKK